MSLLSHWVDSGREPKCAPNPAYPFGVDIDAACQTTDACKLSLLYPAPRIGYHVVECSRCRQTCVITTAGRSDDPRSVRIPCQQQKAQH